MRIEKKNGQFDLQSTSAECCRRSERHHDLNPARQANSHLINRNRFAAKFDLAKRGLIFVPFDT